MAAPPFVTLVARHPSNPRRHLLNTVKGALAKARADAQTLNKKIHSMTLKDRAAVRGHLENVAVQAQALGRSVQSLADSQNAEGRDRLRDAGTALAAAARESKDLATTSKTDLSDAHKALFAKARAAASHLSQAIAAERSNDALVRS
jgi:hypothetical protein